MPIRVHLDRLLLERRLTLTELAERVGITVANLSVLKTGRARAIRFSTLEAICRELDCTPGDVLSYQSDQPAPPEAATSQPAPPGAATPETARASAATSPPPTAGNQMMGARGGS